MWWNTSPLCRALNTSFLWGTLNTSFFNYAFIFNLWVFANRTIEELYCEIIKAMAAVSCKRKDHNNYAISLWWEPHIHQMHKPSEKGNNRGGHSSIQGVMVEAKVEEKKQQDRISTLRKFKKSTRRRWLWYRSGKGDEADWIQFDDCGTWHLVQYTENIILLFLIPPTPSHVKLSVCKERSS